MRQSTITKKKTLEKFYDFEKRYKESFEEKIDTDTMTCSEHDFNHMSTVTVMPKYVYHPNIYDEFTRIERRILKKIHVL